MFALSQFSASDNLGARNRLRAYNRKFTTPSSLRGDGIAGGGVGEQIFGTQFLVKKKNRSEAKTNRQTFSLWHKRTSSGSVSLCLNCNRYAPINVNPFGGGRGVRARGGFDAWDYPPCRAFDRAKQPRVNPWFGTFDFDR